jgi:hypothetical protein
MALTKDQKIGLASAGIGLVGLYYYHKQKSDATVGNNTTNVPVNTQGSIQPYTPQSPIALQPGESIYDPNTEGLYTTPSGQGGPNQFPSVTGQTQSPGAPHYRINVHYPRPHHHQRHHKKAAKRTHHGKHGHHNNKHMAQHHGKGKGGGGGGGESENDSGSG